MAVVLSDAPTPARKADAAALRATKRFGGRRGRVARRRQSRCMGHFAVICAFRLLIVPACWLFIRNPVHRVRAVRGFVYQLMSNYVRIMRALRLIDLEISGLDAAPAPGSLIVANHPSLIDALILLGHVKGAVVVAKRSLQVSFFTAGGIRGADYVVNADALSLIEECRARIAAGESLVLFPECTRTADDGVIRLQRGAAHIAVRSGCPVIPVTIEISEPLLTKKSRWWLAPKVRPSVRVVGHPAMTQRRSAWGSQGVARRASVNRTFASVVRQGACRRDPLNTNAR